MKRKRGPTVVWDGGREDYICRDERCTVEEVHLSHDIDDTHEVISARKVLWGWVLDPFEKSPSNIRRKHSRASPGVDRRLIRPAHVQLLDDCILHAISPLTIKPFRVLYEDVVGDYGSCDERRMRRRLECLRREERVAYLRFDAVGMISGYTTPGSSLLQDPILVREILWRQASDFGEREAI